MARRLSVNSSNCMTLFQYAIVKELIESLGVHVSELAESLDIEYTTFATWVNAKAFPREDVFYHITENYGVIKKYGTYDRYKNDYNEYRKNPKWPTRGLQEVLKSSGLTWFKNEGVFREGTTEHVEKRKRNLLREFEKVATSTGSEESKSFSASLFDKLYRLGDIPKDEDLDISCIIDPNECQNCIDRINDKIAELDKLRFHLNEVRNVIRYMRVEYERVMTVKPSDLEIDIKEDKWKEVKSILKG